MENHRMSLETLASMEYPVLLDTSVLLGYSNINRNQITLTEKFAKAKESYDFFVLMQDYVKNGSNFCITSLVSEELQNGYSFSLKKSIKKVGYCEDRKLLELHRKRRDSSKEQRILDRTFQENNKILQLRKDEQILYDLIYNGNFELKEKYKLSESNFDFLISGMVLAKANGIAALVSNDKGIFRARKDVLMKENFQFHKVKFFIRENFLSF
ncbi:MAG: hypothetical protein AABX80_02900, partial [Nanoarchaeota archaeon]